jgi:hypothetical protein
VEKTLGNYAPPSVDGERAREMMQQRRFTSDFATLREVFLPRKNAYRIDYRGAAVLDIGSHKGYLGALEKRTLSPRVCP